MRRQSLERRNGMLLALLSKCLHSPLVHTLTYLWSMAVYLWVINLPLQRQISFASRRMVIFILLPVQNTHGAWSSVICKLTLPWLKTVIKWLVNFVAICCSWPLLLNETQRYFRIPSKHILWDKWHVWKSVNKKRNLQSIQTFFICLWVFFFLFYCGKF